MSSGPETTNARPGASANGSRPSGSCDPAPIPPATQHSASATARPPSAMSWALRRAPAADRVPDPACAPRIASSSASGSAPDGGRPRELGELRARQRGLERADERDRIAIARKAEPPAARDRRRACRRCRRPGWGRSARPGPRCRARRCRPRPGSPSAWHASASPSTASVSCHATCGFSGLPKFRQLVSPSGSAPTQARLAAHSYTASAAPRRGSHATRLPLPSIETAIARAVGQRQHGGVGLLRAADGARLHDRVVLLEHGPARGDVRRAEQREQHLAGVSSAAQHGPPARGSTRRSPAGSARGRTAGSRPPALGPAGRRPPSRGRAPARDVRR